MNKLKTSVKMLAIASIILTFCAGIVFSQMPFEGGSEKPQGRPSLQGAASGEVVEINEKTIVVLSSDGVKKELTITPNTSFVKEVSISKSELKKDDNLLIIGQMIKIFDKKEDMPPFLRERLGVITELEPLTVRYGSGKTETIKITEVTRILKEIPIAISEIKKGIKVRVIAPPKPGGESREALKIIVLSEEGPSFREKSSLATLTLPDLPQQSKDSDFIYGIWLGRGLYSNKELDRAFRVASNLGLEYFNVEFKWDYVEPQNDRWQWNNKETLDVERVIKLAKQYNISIIPYFDIFMPWGEVKYLDPKKGECEGMPSRRGQHQAPIPEEYAEYVFAVVKKLKEGGVEVKYVELDNEDSNQNDGYRSWNCFMNVTAKQLKEAENAAYDKVKATYPDVMVSSTTFAFPGLSCGGFGDCEKDKKVRNSFIKAYFGDSPKPKFDFLGIHETLGGSGSPYTTYEKLANAAYQYNFGSYYNAYDMWREILNKYGYINIPIFNLESESGIPGQKQDARLLQKIIFARTQAHKNNIIGVVVSQITMSNQSLVLRGGRPDRGITALKDGYQLEEGYYAYYTLMTTLAKYPKYEGKVMGDLNTQNPWVEKFNDGKGNTLYVAFLPYHFGFGKQQAVSLKIGSNKEVRLTRSDTTTSTMKSDGSGNVTLEVDQNPIFIEVRR